MDTDSLFKRRIQQLKTQPDTVRGKLITWYASLENRPYIRMLLLGVLCIFVMAHTVTFCMLLKSYVLNLRQSYSLFITTLPIILLISYTIVLVPFVITFMITDIKVKKEGLLAWHRDSLGILT